MSFIECPVHRGVDEHDIGGNAGREGASVELEECCGLGGEEGEEAGERDGEALPLALPRALLRLLVLALALPPVALPRRMWAGGRLEFRRPILVGDALTRVSTIDAVAEKLHWVLLK